MSKKCADTQTQDDYCNPPPTLGLIIVDNNYTTIGNSHTTSIRLNLKSGSCIFRVSLCKGASNTLGIY